MVELFEKSGILSLGSRLRWLSDMVTRDAGEIYKIYGLDIKPKWFPVLYMLFKGTDNSVTGIAKSIGQTHPSVSNLVKELTAAGLTEESKSGDDRRTTLVRLSAKGRKLEPQLMQVCEDVKAVVESIDSKATDRLWNAIGYWERCLDEKSLLARVADERKRRESDVVEIVDYSPEHLEVFKRLNIMWINSHWSLEPHDLEVLSSPEDAILSKGGCVLVALVGGRAMGVVALCRMNNSEYDFELAKLAVDPEARGSGIGEAICRAAIARAESLGAKRLFLESNTLLKPAISLYRKIGFTELKEYHPAYKRGDIQMELTIKK
ncbi:MAG: bifunctional helix-turn-helix transcriptional regulator/GNAT family N-acetyltransferase [Muribaculaceae bacterium]|nr:bifunctional helix-turn-helix transcriptional regulator/GNAT family N-acetyltransferase [Muribaculaceae bacterium]